MTRNFIFWLVLLTTSVAMADPLDDCVRHEMEAGGLPGVSVAIERDGQIVLSRSYGVKDLASKERVTPQTLFQAASISKPFVALAAMLLVEQKRLSLDDDVNDHLEQWKVPADSFTQESKVTVRRILSHSAGFSIHGFVGYSPGQSIPSLPQILDGQPPANSASVRVEFVPGSKEQYSGGGYEVLQQLIMDVTREPFPHFMEATVLQPLRMNRSTFEQPLPTELVGAAASGYYLNGNPLPGRWNIYPEMAAAGLWTTPEDLCRFISAMQKARLGGTEGPVTPEIAREMLTQTAGNFGLGLKLSSDGKRFWHDGRTIGFDSLIFGSAHLGGAVMINRNVNNGAIERILHKAVELAEVAQ